MKSWNNLELWLNTLLITEQRVGSHFTRHTNVKKPYDPLRCRHRDKSPANDTLLPWLNTAFKPDISGSIPQSLFKYGGFHLINVFVNWARWLVCQCVCMCLWVKEKLINISFTFLADNKKDKYDTVLLRTDGSSCDLSLLGWPVIAFLQAFNQPVDVSKANDQVMAKSKFHKSQKYLLMHFLAFGREWLKSEWEWFAEVSTEMRLLSRIPYLWEISPFFDVLNPNVVIHMEWQQKKSFKGNQPKVMRMPWLGLLICKKYNSVS